MKYYDGPKPGDEKPIGGGSYSEDHCGDEVFNFKRTRRRFYGFCQPQVRAQSINLERIHPGTNQNSLKGVLVIFVAVDPEKGGQRVVGWYRKATVYRTRQDSTSQRRKKTPFFAMTALKNAVLLPVAPYKRNWLVPAGKGGIGQANLCYLYEADGSEKRMRWSREIIKLVQNYRGTNQITR